MHRCNCFLLIGDHMMFPLKETRCWRTALMETSCFFPHFAFWGNSVVAEQTTEFQFPVLRFLLLSQLSILKWTFVESLISSGPVNIHDLNIRIQTVLVTHIEISIYILWISFLVVCQKYTVLLKSLTVSLSDWAVVVCSTSAPHWLRPSRPKWGFSGSRHVVNPNCRL